MSVDPRAAVLDESLSCLEEARRDVEAAEKQLEQVLADIRIAPRAEKTSVSKAIELALNQVRAARVKVTDAESVVASGIETKR